jgi:cell division septum initiation protein DivIVA
MTASFAIRSDVAGDVPGLDPAHATGILGWLGGLATATVGAIGLWLAQRVLGKAAFQTAINDGFSKLTADLQEERDRLTKEVAAERQAFAADRLVWSEEKAQLKGRIRQLEQQLESLHRKLGLETPGHLEPEAGATQL